MFDPWLNPKSRFPKLQFYNKNDSFFVGLKKT